jgi:hypothetical protein
MTSVIDGAGWTNYRLPGYWRRETREKSRFHPIELSEDYPPFASFVKGLFSGFFVR